GVEVQALAITERVHESGGHDRTDVGLASDVGFGHGDLLACNVTEDHFLRSLARLDARGLGAILELEGHRVIALLHLRIWRQDALDDVIHRRAGAEGGERRSDDAARATDGVAGGATARSPAVD